MSMTMVRKKGATEWYRPEYDLGNCWIFMAQAVADRFDKNDPNAWCAPVLRDLGVTSDQYPAAIQSLAEFFNACRNPEVVSVAQAFEVSGLSKLDPSVQAALFFRFGQVAVSTSYLAIRTIQFEEDIDRSNQAALARLVKQSVDIFDAAERRRAWSWFPRLISSLRKMFSKKA